MSRSSSDLPKGYRYRLTQETDWSTDPDDEIETSVQVSVIQTSWIRSLFNKEKVVALAIGGVHSRMTEEETRSKVEALYVEAKKSFCER